MNLTFTQADFEIQTTMNFNKGCIMNKEELMKKVEKLLALAGNWRVLEYDHKEFDMTNGGCKARHLYRCKCSCGTTRLVRRDSLIQKNSRSCGCKRRKHNL